MEEYGDMQTDIANARIPYFSTLQLDGDDAGAKEGNDYSDFKPAPNRTDVPPITTTDAIIIMRPANIQFANASSVGYPIRGEKLWQGWAGDMETYGDIQTDQANARPPYNSTVQLKDDMKVPVADNALL